MRDETGLQGRFRHPSPDELAAAQGGMVSVAQLRDAGLSDKSIRGRVAKGVLHDAGRGVYAVGYPRRDDEARAWRAALMYPGTALNRTSGAWAHGLRKELGRVHLASLTRRRSTEVATVHHVKELEVVDQRGLPCTTLARTFLDVAATEPEQVLVAMLHRAEELRTFDLRSILPLLDERRGSPALRTALALHRAAAEAPTRSELERRFRSLVLDARLPEPLWNLFVESFWVDAFWAAQRVVVELDGGQHRTVSKQDSDTRRNAVLTAAGYIPLRFTWAQVTTDRAHVLRTLRAVL
jgi:very-short-patch-repair endonuclease